MGLNEEFALRRLYERVGIALPIANNGGQIDDLWDVDDRFIGNVDGNLNAELIVGAVNAVPGLLDEIQRLRAQIDIIAGTADVEGHAFAHGFLGLAARNYLTEGTPSSRSLLDIAITRYERSLQESKQRRRAIERLIAAAKALVRESCVSDDLPEFPRLADALRQLDEASTPTTDPGAPPAEQP